MKKNILICTYYYEPEITPRAFRAKEIAEALSENNYNITVITKQLHNNDNKVYYVNENLLIKKIKPGFFLNSFKWQKIRLGLLKYFIHFIYLGGINFEYSIMLFFNLIKNKKKYDVVISIGLPFSVHFGVALYKLFCDRNIIAIADYGDPFSKSSKYKYILHYYIIEKFVLKLFDFLVVPTEKALKAYKGLFNRNKIFIIPQSISSKKIKICNYVPNKSLKFAYAGLFYIDIRNPQKFIDYLLNKSDKYDFKFIIYTDINHNETYKCLEKYLSNHSDKIIIEKPLERYNCIEVLSSMDFIINFENTTQVQVPSKLIDYYFTKRPILNINPNYLDEMKIERFLHRNFVDEDYLKLNVHEYLSENVVQKYIKLFSMSITDD